MSKSKTIQKWDRLGILHAKRTITNRRYYTVRISQPLCGCLVSHPSDAQRAYCRVSSQAQKPELTNQKRIFEQECRQQHIEVDEWIMEIGGGMNLKRTHNSRLVDQILAGEVERLVLARPGCSST
jgi:predicted site-specific integrase-resolvase